MYKASNLAKQRSKDFKHQLVQKFNLIQETTDGVRFYVTPDGKRYKSVTTIIDEKADKSWLIEWKMKVGDIEANRIKEFAGLRGNNIHGMAERFLLNNDQWFKGQGIYNILDFNKLIPILDKNIDLVYGSEIPLWSDKYQTAGTTDVACIWNKKNTILDFKTSRRLKTKEDITDYFIQATIYSLMFQEIYNILIEQIVILMLVDHEDEPSVFVVDPWMYIDKVEEYFLGGGY